MGDDTRRTLPASKRGRRPAHAPPTPMTREQVLDAAGSQFSAAGYDGVSIRSIAKAARTDPALVHYYFGTKDEPFAARSSSSTPSTSRRR